MSGVLHGVSVMGFGSQQVETDAYPSNTKLLLKANSNGTFTDASTSGRTVSAFNGVATSTTVAKFGGRSASFDGVNDYLSVADSDDWDYGTGDFTIETWVYLNTTNQVATLVGDYDTSGSILQFRNDQSPTGFVWGVGDNQHIVRAYSIANSWVHVAVSRSGTSLRMFFDGVQQGATVTNSVNVSSAQPLNIGRLRVFESLFVQYFNGYLQDLRITKGVARYTADFLPPRLT